MEKTLEIIELPQLALAFLPVLVVLFIQFSWSLPQKRTIHALARMLVQLLLVGFFLSYVFESDSAWLVLILLIIMVFFSSWIALNNIEAPKRELFQRAVLAISVSSVLTLLIITQGVLQLSPWYHAQTLIPLAGMVFASSMNSISLSGERFYSELANKVSYKKARNIAFQASMIPNVNALLAVGIVSLPGMMTGQILSGVSPFIAARYQIMVMCMIFASAGISSAYFLYLARTNLKPKS
ncbi:ABC transporter permease [Colwellia demingiae]|uniref:ABC transporter permease n=1 Tax=Colwellia demingiae TaxID=89401 RepID=A0A5C6QJ03_9GAMM|nr:ABC transporter permease [Colwellia demingiae]TWX68914.1 ABC transporter permease [Colwellia demingiae]